MELLILTFNLLIFIIYNVYILKEFGVPESLSETTYLLKDKYWIFTLLCFITSFTLLPLWLGVCNNHNFDFLKFFSLGSLLFVGSTPFFKESLQKQIHYTSAIICFISIILWFFMQNFLTYIMIYILLAIFSSFIVKKENYIYIAEIILWFIIIIFLIVQYL